MSVSVEVLCAGCSAQMPNKIMGDDYFGARRVHSGFCEKCQKATADEKYRAEIKEDARIKLKALDASEAPKPEPVAVADKAVEPESDHKPEPWKKKKWHGGA